MSNLLEILDHIDPAKLDYQEWVNVGMALKDEGYACSDWDKWSKSDTARYHDGDCEKKWRSFNGSAAPVTAGTIVQYAKNQGWQPYHDSSANTKVFDWDDEINAEAEILSSGEGIKLCEPSEWHPGMEIIRYLETLFNASENVGFVTESWQKEENGKVKYLPTKGSCADTAGELIAKLAKYGDDIGAVFGDYNPAAGAWIRFNPLDGKGIKNENVTDFRYALVESDSMAIEEQQAVIRELELPVAVMVYSGGKSIHSIVKVDAPNYDEYRRRVDYLYSVCKKNGLDIDKQNRNPSRLSRMPGVTRNGKKQYIIDTNIGKADWAEWKDYIEGINDDMPDTENLADEWENLPKLSPPLIHGILRQGHKMLVAGPSKAGKSYALIELCTAIAEGTSWFGFRCTQGKVLYVNLELDRASCLHRFKDVYIALSITPRGLKNIDIWNLRGKSVPMDKLAPKLIRRANKKNYLAIVIDPIYKVITGDENSADQMAHFCNQFDKICTELGCAVIYCHHHSKGSQGGKRSMDRVSGSGVFARDPDALLDLTELEVTDSVRTAEENAFVCKKCLEWILRFKPDFKENVSQDDLFSAPQMREHAKRILELNSCRLMNEEIDKGKKLLSKRTAWRIEGTLREFERFDPLNLWFEYPVHVPDEKCTLKDLSTEAPAYQKNFSKKKTAEENSADRKESLETAFSAVQENGETTFAELSSYLGKTPKTVERWVTEHGGFWREGKKIGLKK